MHDEESPRWSISDVPYDRIDASLIARDSPVFYLVIASSFVEIASDLYTRNLLEYYRDDGDIAGWLDDHWQHEEVQHGYALKRYVNHAWPDFDWDTAFANFIAEYAPTCTVDQFEKTRGLEMAARCVVEMGTATYYSALAKGTTEPVLQELAGYIRADEVRHYKHFFEYFKRFQQRDGIGRVAIMGALMRRLFEVRDGDADTSLWHAYAICHPDAKRNSAAFRDMVSQAGTLVRRQFPTMMAVKMLLKPLNLPMLMQRIFYRPFAVIAERIILR